MAAKIQRRYRKPGRVQPRPKPRAIKKLKGQVTLAARATIFARQQRERRVRSIVGRVGTGRLTPEQQRDLRAFAGRKRDAILQRIPVNSSWVAEVLLVATGDGPALGVKFLNDVTVVYTNTSLNDFEMMARAASKGKFIWARLYHGIPGAGAPYRKI